jgi:1-acyl-sn-glycerol-3-phosphate acyltransferase
LFRQCVPPAGRDRACDEQSALRAVIGQNGGMAFSWLPGSEHYTHPRFSWLIACGFDVFINAAYRREVILPPGFRLHPGTLIVSNHLRDSDVPILTALLCRREGLRIRDPLPFFATREDLLQPDALAWLVPRWPRRWARLAGRIRLGWFFDNVRALPMRRLREFTLGETLQELCGAGFGGADPAAVLNARGRREVAAALGRLPAKVAELDADTLGALRYHRWGLRRLELATLRRLAPRLRAAIRAQLDGFAALLAAGHSVYLAPEGTISATGAFGRVRAGARLLCRGNGVPARLLPLALSYDPLGPGRLRVVCHVGEPLIGLDPSDQRRFAAGLRRSILGLYAVNPSHLIAHFLCSGPERFSSAEFTGFLRHATGAIAASDSTLDPLLLRTPAEELARTRLAWLQRSRLLEGDAGQWRNRWARQTRPGWRRPEQVVRYLANALADLDPGLARSLGP